VKEKNEIEKKNSKMEVPAQLKHLSSDVDWCEQNYIVLPFIAEFWNTISNVLFLVIPPILMIKFRQYSEETKMPINHIWKLLMVVGLGSVYFHSTLSLIGQLVDEIAILWVIMCSWSLFVPSSVLEKLFPSGIDRGVFRFMMLGMTLFLTMMCLYEPEVNHNALHLFAIPCVGYTVYKARYTKSETAFKLSTIAILWFVLGFGSWLVDRNFCEYLSAFPYLHCFWHIFICLGAYLSIVCHAFYFAESEHPESDPMIRFFPCENSFPTQMIGIPYVTLSKPIKIKDI